MMPESYVKEQLLMWVIERLGAGQRDRAKALFALLSEVLGDTRGPVTDSYVDRLLQQDSFWAFAAIENNRVIAGLTAHVLPMTNAERAELLVYDIAVTEDYQRRGIGRQLIQAARNEATSQGIDVVFVLADNEDAHALDFYRASGASGSPVTLFEWDDEQKATRPGSPTYNDSCV